MAPGWLTALLVLAIHTTTTAHAEVFPFVLKIHSPSGLYSESVVPVFVSLDDLPSDSSSDSALPPPSSILTLTTPSSLYIPSLIDTLPFRLCLHLSGESFYRCLPSRLSPSLLNNVFYTPCSLFRQPAGDHSLAVWIRDASLDSYAEGTTDTYATSEYRFTGTEYGTDCGGGASSESSSSSSSSVVVPPSSSIAWTCSRFTVSTALLRDPSADASASSLAATVKSLSRSSSDVDPSSPGRRSSYFDEIYEYEVWSFPDLSTPLGAFGVRSGFGSTLHQTVNLRQFLTTFMQNTCVTSVVDVPCGDLYWMPFVTALSDGYAVEESACTPTIFSPSSSSQSSSPSLSDGASDRFVFPRYFGGDVSPFAIGSLRERLSLPPNGPAGGGGGGGGGNGSLFGGRGDVGVVDLVSDELISVPGVRAAVFGYDGGGDDDSVGSTAGGRRSVGGSGGSVLLHVRHLMFHLTPEENVSVLKNVQSFASSISVEAPGRRVYVLLSTYLRGSDNEKEYMLKDGHSINLLNWPYCLSDPLYLVQDGVDDLFGGIWDVTGGRDFWFKRDDELRTCVFREEAN